MNRMLSGTVEFHFIKFKKCFFQLKMIKTPMMILMILMMMRGHLFQVIDLFRILKVFFVTLKL
jgi:hypothetical protein